MRRFVAARDIREGDVLVVAGETRTVTAVARQRDPDGGGFVRVHLGLDVGGPLIRREAFRLEVVR